MQKSPGMCGTAQWQCAQTYNAAVERAWCSGKGTWACGAFGRQSWVCSVVEGGRGMQCAAPEVSATHHSLQGMQHLVTLEMDSPTSGYRLDFLDKRL